MSRLVVVSNRVALPGQPSSGGLAVALQAALEDNALQQQGGLWFGWSGRIDPDRSGELHEQSHNGIDYVTLDLSQADHDDYYNGFANRTLWPLLHFRVDLVDYSRETYAAYRRVNALFAEKLAPLLRDDDIVWIHDYHLIPRAQLLRQRGIKCRLGFFLHVPMPSSDLLAALPDHNRLFEGLSSYDLIGFQTERDLERFQDYVRLFGRGEVIESGVLATAKGHRLRAGAFPISIDTAGIERQAAAAVGKSSFKRLARSLSGRALAIGVDRLDYSKGLPERFRAFERYLQRYPDQIGELTYLQIAPVSRGDVLEYQTLRSELEQLAGHINGGHAEPDWTPMRYVNRNFPHASLTGFYRLARLGLVTPLRDGMNLVAKEYVAAQNPSDPGVLILSRFAGSALQLRQALIVNPYSPEELSDAMKRAVTMPREERIERWQALYECVQDEDVTAWRDAYVRALSGDDEEPAPPPRVSDLRTEGYVSH